MAIDSSLFGADLPAGTYTAGDTIPLTIIDGPSVVRSGRGAAILKRITVGQISDMAGSTSAWKICIKNSDWIDEAASLSAPMSAATALDERSGCIQSGQNCPLTPNSSWEVYAVATETVTTTVANSIWALIDIDYPSVSSIITPDALVGFPTSIENARTINASVLGTLVGSGWDTYNEDLFKAGYEYALVKTELMFGAGGVAGFVALANAAGMGGLQRIIPIANFPQAIRNKIEYATKLVKGPMDIRYKMFATGNVAASATGKLLLDFVKRRV